MSKSRTAQSSESPSPPAPAGFEHIGQILPCVLDELFVTVMSKETDRPLSGGDPDWARAA